MSGFTQFPPSSSRYTTAYSYDMPPNPAVGTMVWQLDHEVLVAWNGSSWVRTDGQGQEKTLYVGKPGTVFVGITIEDRYRPAAGVEAVVTNITISYPTGGSAPLAVILKPDAAAGVYFSYFSDIYPSTILSMDMYLPMSETDSIGAGVSLSEVSDFDGDTTLIITGIEYPS